MFLPVCLFISIYLSTIKGLRSVEGYFCKANVNLLEQPLYRKKVTFILMDKIKATVSVIYQVLEEQFFLAMPQLNP